MAYTRESSVYQRSVLGPEITKGLLVPATARMPSLLTAVSQMVDIKRYRSQGSKVHGASVLNRQWSGFKYDGSGCFDELPYLFSSLLTKTGMGPVGGLWTFQPSVDTPDDPQTYTLEHGSPTNCRRSVNNIVADMMLSVTREEFKVSGSGFGKLLTPGVTPTPTPTLINNTPVSAAGVSLYVDDTVEALGTTKLSAAYTYDLSIGSRWAPNWVLDEALTSWKDELETVPVVTLKMKIMDNTEGHDFITQMVNDKVKYLSFVANGPARATGVTGAPAPYNLTINMPFIVINPSEPQDLAGAYIVEWELAPQIDGPFLTAKNNAFMEVLIANSLAAL